MNRQTKEDLEMLERYNDYFDECERRNRIPLSLEEWKAKNA